jgi:hypothetical protein
MMVFNRPASLWSSLNPKAGRSEIAVLTVSGPHDHAETIRDFTWWVYATAKRGAPWWRVTPIKDWTFAGESHQTDSAFLQPYAWARRRDRALGLGVFLLYLAACVALGGLTAIAAAYLLGITNAWITMSLVIAVGVSVPCAARWIVPDVEIARYRETRLDKVARRGMQIGVSVLLAVLTKRVFRQ